ncbi:MAG: hypothetical protein IT564_11435 [Rhodospirillales bacterium]|nr:hypothetical protein [Rhodospirillales bacterium]
MVVQFIPNDDGDERRSIWPFVPKDTKPEATDIRLDAICGPINDVPAVRVVLEGMSLTIAEAQQLANTLDLVIKAAETMAERHGIKE